MRAIRSSTWPLVGMIVTSGSTSPVGRITCSTIWAECSSSKAPGRGRHEHALGHPLDELVEAQRPVVLGRGQAEAVLDQHVLARPVPGVLPVQLGHGHVALVDHAQVVLGEEVQQRVGRLPRCPAVEVAAVVLDPRADARSRPASRGRARCAPAAAAPRAACPPCSNSWSRSRSSTSMLPTARWMISSPVT